MNRAETFLLAGRTYTRKTATERVREISGAVTTEDDLLLRDLVARHPRAHEKIGTGIRRFILEGEDPVRLSIGRTDYSREIFSWPKCIDARESSQKERASKAMRTAVMEQRDAMRSELFARGPVRCAIAGELLAPENCHLDHVPPFWALAAEFAAGEGGWGGILTREHDGRLGRVTADFDQERRWQGFHLERAQLQPVSAKVNISKGAKWPTAIERQAISYGAGSIRETNARGQLELEPPPAA